MSASGRPRRRPLAGLGPNSRVRSEGGWVWLESDPVSVRRRSILLLVPAAALVAGLRLATGQLPAWIAVVEVFTLLALATFVFVRFYKPASARIGAATLGITLQHGLHAETVAWGAVVRVRVDDGPRTLVHVELDDGPRCSDTTYTAAHASAWMRDASAVAPPHVEWTDGADPAPGVSGGQEVR